MQSGVWQIFRRAAAPFLSPLAFLLYQPPKPARKIEHTEVTFRTRLKNKNFKGEHPHILNCLLCFDIMNDPWMINNDPRFTYEKDELQNWIAFKKNKLKEQWQKLTPTDEQTAEDFNVWISKQPIESPCSGIFIESCQPNEPRKQLIATYVRLIESLPALSEVEQIGKVKILHFEALGIKLKREFPVTVQTFIKEFNAALDATNLADLSQFRQLSYINKMKECVEINKDLITMADMITSWKLHLQAYHDFVRDLIQRSNNNADSRETEFKEVLVYNQHKNSFDLFTLMYNIECLLGHARVLLHMAEANMLTYNKFDFKEENFDVFILRLKEELRVRSELIETTRKLIYFHKHHFTIGEDDRVKLISKLEQAVEAHVNSKRRNYIIKFLEGVPILHELQENLEAATLHVSSQVRAISAQLQMIQNSKKELDEIKADLRIDAQLTREDLIKLYEEQKFNQLSEIFYAKKRLIDHLEVFLNVARQILRSESHHIDQDTYNEKEIIEQCRLYDELLFSLLPDDARKTAETAPTDLKSAENKSGSKQRLNLFREFHPLNSSIVFFRPMAFQLRQPTVPLIEYQPKLEPKSS